MAKVPSVSCVLPPVLKVAILFLPTPFAGLLGTSRSQVVRHSTSFLPAKPIRYSSLSCFTQSETSEYIITLAVAVVRMALHLWILDTTEFTLSSRKA